jgi:peptidoglycan/LPS O-acetylase OafA/YrhL
MPPRYRSDIDGLRAVAVMAVILFHTFPRWLPGGFVGVDIFFVVSGYLITQLLLGDLSENKFSAVDFYRRRIRRIFPALIVVLIAVLALGWHFLIPEQLTSLSKDTVASALFSANLMLLSETGYFDIAAHLKPLLHLWSLGVEEQFYLAWPWILWALPRRWLTLAIMLMMFGSFALNVAIVDGHPSAAFYLPFTRAWELLVGAIVARAPPLTGRLGNVVAFAGLAMIEVCLFGFGAQTVFPGWAAVVPVCGAVMVIMAEQSLFNRVVLSHPVMVRTGLISYPMYLWHWPILVFGEIVQLRPFTDPENGLTIGVTWLLAWLTYRWLERPIRSRGLAAVKPLVAIMAAVVVAALVPALGYVPPLPVEIAHLMQVSPTAEGQRTHECMFSDMDTAPFAPDCVENKRPLIAIWGDSTAGALMPGLRKLQQTSSFGIAQFTVTSCQPLVVQVERMSRQCLERNRGIVELISASAPDVVVLQAIWDVDQAVEKLGLTVEALRSRGAARIVVIGRMPTWRGGLPAIVAAHFRRTGQILPERTTEYVEADLAADRRLQALASSLAVDYISPRDLLCDAEGCITRIGGTLIASDSVHLTIPGAEFFARSIAPQLGLDGSRS